VGVCHLIHGDAVGSRAFANVVVLVVVGGVLWNQGAIEAPEKTAGFAIAPVAMATGRHQVADSSAAMETAIPLPVLPKPVPVRPRPPAPPPLPAEYFDLLIPVQGIGAEDLRDTFTDRRSGGRVHRAIDIMAPRGTSVLAAADGEIIRMDTTRLGGIIIYQRDPAGKVVYYYAHLDGFAEGLQVGHFARQGEVIGYVGDTGNAAPGQYHLHFAIWVVRNPHRLTGAVGMNPFPLLTRATDQAL
jgi:peptidoglycan LD-endopeptidase LytH